MIPVDSLLYKIDQKLNKLSTNEHQQIPLEDKILALNEAQLKLIKQKVDGISTPSGLGFDSFKKRYEDLQSIIVDYKPLPLTLQNSQLNQYVADLTELEPDYMFYVNSYALAEKGRCKGKVIWVNQDLAKHSSIQLLLNNDHYKPSFEYEETFNTISSDEISLYTDGTFTFTNIYVSYVRYPVYIDKVGYIRFNGTPSVNEDCELESYLEDELVDLAVRELAAYIENASAFQAAQTRIQTNE